MRTEVGDAPWSFVAVERRTARAVIEVTLEGSNSSTRLAEYSMQGAGRCLAACSASDGALWHRLPAVAPPACCDARSRQIRRNTLQCGPATQRLGGDDGECRARQNPEV